MHTLLAAHLLAWRKETLYPSDNDFVFPSLRLKGKKPPVANMLVADYLRVAARKAGVVAPPRTFGFPFLPFLLRNPNIALPNAQPRRLALLLSATMKLVRNVLLCLVTMLSVKTNLLGAKARLECNADGTERYALVVGNAKYAQTDGTTFDPLPKVVRDREDMAKALCALGFTVSLGVDQNLQEMKQDVNDLRANDAQLVVVYFSGHGLQQGGFNYLIPIGTQIGLGDDIEEKALNVADVYDALNTGPDVPGHAALIVLDACRSNFFSESGKATPGLAIPSDAPAGTTVAFATAPGTKAYPSVTVNNVVLDHSPYTEFFLRYIYQRGLTLPELFANLRRDLMKASRNQQISWENSSALESTFLAKPVLAEWRVLDVDDVIEVRLKNQPVLQRTYAAGWDPTSPELLKPGRNPFEIRIYNDKTFHNNNPAIREGWHYRLKLRVDGGKEYQFACSEDQPPRSRWGQVFTTYSGYIDVSPSDGSVSVSESACNYGTSVMN